MKSFLLQQLSILSALLIVTSLSALGADVEEALPTSGKEAEVEVSTIPEPSVAMIGGLCGILFLFWRRK